MFGGRSATQHPPPPQVLKGPKNSEFYRVHTSMEGLEGGGGAEQGSMVYFRSHLVNPHVQAVQNMCDKGG